MTQHPRKLGASLGVFLGWTALHLFPVAVVLYAVFQ